MTAAVARTARVEKVAAALRRAGLDAPILSLRENTSTAALAAAALQCEVGEIAKSLMFRCVDDNSPVLAVLSGAVRVDVQKLSQAAGGKALIKANAAFVKEKTGFEIGGVPPLGHDCPLTVVVDSGLLRYSQVWAAAGSAFAVFPSAPSALAAAADAIIADIAEIAE